MIQLAGLSSVVNGMATDPNNDAAHAVPKHN